LVFLHPSSQGIAVFLDAHLPTVPLAEVPDVAAAAERLGFDALWTSETKHDPFLPCALIAENTRRLRLGTAIAVSFARSPATLAQLAWDLAAQSHGRFILGLGTQVRAHIERRFGMPWPDSVLAKLREQVLAVRAFWETWQQGTRLNFRGEYYKLTLLSPFFDPGPISHPAIPIYIAGVNKGLAALAGEICDGFFVHPFHSPLYLTDVVLPAIESGLKKAGKHRSRFAVSVSVFVATSAAERDSARAQIAFYASTPSYRPVMELHGWGHAAAQLSALAARSRWDHMSALVTDEMLGEFCLCTDEAGLGHAVRDRYQGRADRVGVYAPFVPGERDGFWARLSADFGSHPQ
jgi:probable F420-dependent oxidoreductase